MTSLVAIILVLVLLVLAWFGVPHLVKALGQRRLRKVCQEHRLIVLSYDDGPGSIVTPRILQMLSEARLRASFFLLGRNTIQHPDIVARIVSDGHDLGSHTHDHSNAWKSPPWQWHRDVTNGIQRISELGVPSQLFRPPFGKLALPGLLHPGIRDGELAWWTIDSGDTWTPIVGADEVLEKIRRDRGGVVLLHDLDRPGADTTRMDYVVDLTEKIIRLAANENYRVVPLSEVLELR